MEVGDLRSWIERADRAESEGDDFAAADALEHWVAAAPDDPTAWKRLARIYQEMDRDQEALAALVRAASIYTEAGAGILAIATCRWILEVDPTHTATLDRLAALRNHAGVPEVTRLRRQDLPPKTSSARSDAPLEEVLLTELVDPDAPVGVAGTREIDLGPIDSPDSPDTMEPPEPGAKLDAKAEDDAARETVRTAARGLVATPLFGQLGASALRKLIAASSLRDLAEGEVLFRQGDAPDALYVVIEGAVVPVAEGETRRRLSVLEAGDFFGEISLVTNEPRNATIEALVDTQLLALERAAMRELIEDEPEMLAVLLRFLRERLSSRLIQTSPVFASLGRQQRSDLARQFRLMEVQPDTILIEQGKRTDALYLVLAGELRVIAMENDCDKELATLGAGAPCGEMSLVRDAPAMASIVATRKSWVLLLPRADFERAASAHPGLLDELHQIADDRRSSNLVGFDTSDLEML